MLSVSLGKTYLEGKQVHLPVAQVCLHGEGLLKELLHNFLGRCKDPHRGLMLREWELFMALAVRIGKQMVCCLLPARSILLPVCNN